MVTKFELWWARAVCALALVLGLIMLAGCSGGSGPLSGKIVGLSVQLGGFTVGVSGSFPEPAAAPGSVTIPEIPPNVTPGD